ncbi:MAG: DNA repair protein RadA [Gammaproteobacteria bacterium]|nr:DNA repair protein RadA [Gammaproteobacteria bacterium]
MPKQRVLFICTDCGTEHTKWQGQCSACKSWNSFRELKSQKNESHGLQREPRRAVKLSEVAVKKLSRLSSGQIEFDRVLGGGLVPGSVVLISGNPGAGKSTLLTQVSSFVSGTGAVLYVAGEESLAQVAIRASRLSLPVENLDIVDETSCERLISIWKELAPSVVIVDSIQVMFTENSDSSPGGVNQVRESASLLINQAKVSNTVLILVGHVTKEGSLAGPRTLEHMIDAFISLEGESDSKFRLLRSIKNRFGPVNELGVFAMTERGLKEIKNPSSIFLSRSPELKPGSAVMVVWEGTRPLLLEIQALVDESVLGQARRVVVGLEQNRLAMLLAILNRHGGLQVADQDVFVNAVGGIRISETSSDLALLASVISSFRNWVLPQDLVIFGEVGLSGEIRPVPNGQERIREAFKHGFKTAIIPDGNRPNKLINKSLRTIPVKNLGEVIANLETLSSTN